MLPPPSLPPGAEEKYFTELRLLAQGTPSDYNTTTLEQVAQVIAVEAGVEASAVQMSVVAASVYLIALVAADDSIDAEGHNEKLAASFVNASAANALMTSTGVTVESIDSVGVITKNVMTLSLPPPVSPSPLPVNSSSGDEVASFDTTGIIIFLLVGGGFLILPAVLLALLHLNEKRLRRKWKLRMGSVGVITDALQTKEEENNQKRAQRRAERRATAGGSKKRVQPMPPTAKSEQPQMQQPPHLPAPSPARKMPEPVVDEDMWNEEDFEPQPADHRPAPRLAPPLQVGSQLEPVRSANPSQPSSSRRALMKTMSQGSQPGTQFAVSDAQAAGLAAQYRVQANPMD